MVVVYAEREDNIRIISARLAKRREGRTYEEVPQIVIVTAICLEDYDFSKGVRGKYAKRFGQRSRAIVLDSDVAEVSIDAKSANEALRALANVNSSAIEKSFILSLVLVSMDC